MRAVRAALIVFCLAMLAAGSATAQTIRGTLADETTGQPVESATIRLLDRRGGVIATTSTDRAGNWALTRVPSAIGYSLRAQKAGFATVEVPPFELGAGSLEFALRTRPEVTVLEGVSATAMNYAGFESRRERRLGHAIGPEAVDRRLARIQPETTTRFLLGLQPSIDTGVSRSDLYIKGCKPTYMIDRKLYFPPLDPYPPIDINSLVEPWEIRAVELYTDPQFIPIEFRIVFPPYRCEILVVVWTVRGVGWEPGEK